MKVDTERFVIMSIGELDTLKRVAGRLKTQLEVGKRTTLSAMSSFQEYEMIYNCIVKRNVVKSVANLEELIKQINYWGDYKLGEQVRNAKSNF